MKAELGTIERAYADGYAAAQHKIERLRSSLKVCEATIVENLMGAWSAAESVGIMRHTLKEIRTALSEQRGSDK